MLISGDFFSQIGDFGCAAGHNCGTFGQANMLISLSFSNFLSFRDETRFSMAPSREKQHGDRVLSDVASGMRILPVAAIYGANGAGKSSFYKAIEFLQDLVLNPALDADEQIPVRPFRLDAGSERQPSRFGIEVLAADDRVYRLTLVLSQQRVHDETLQLVGLKSVRLIYRRNEAQAFELGDRFQEALSPADREFLSYKARDTLPNQLLLAVLRGRNIHHVDGIIHWFKDQLQLMTPNTVLKQLEINLSSIADLRQYCIKALTDADTGISGIVPRDVPLGSLPWENFPFGSDYEKWLRKNIPIGKAMLFAIPSGERFTIRHEETGIRATRIATIHRTSDGRDIDFYMSDESDGTQRFVDLLPVFYDLGSSIKRRVIVIDEIDRSLHTMLTRNLISSFLDSLTEKSRSQLVFTAHDVMLLDQDLLRRDEIWFAEKDTTGAARLKPLGEMKGVRKDRVLLRSYLEGEFGGVPRISDLARPSPNVFPVD